MIWDIVKKNKKANRFFNVIESHAQSYEVLEEVDYFFVNQAAYALAMYLEVVVEVEKKGYVYTSEKGYSQVSGHFTASEKYLGQYMEACKHLGLSPYARSKMEKQFDQQAKDYKQDPIAQMLKNSKRDEADA